MTTNSSAQRLPLVSCLERQSDNRSELDLQIDLRADRKMTAVLLLQDIARHPNEARP
jgi:hypothetical protein